MRKNQLQLTLKQKAFILPYKIAKPIKSKTKESKKAQEEEKIAALHPTKGLYTEKPSAKLTSIKTADPFATSSKKHKTAFGYVYTSGGVPCKINHGSISNHLDWDKPPVGIHKLIITFY